MPRRPLWLLLTLTAGCSDLFGPPLPAGTRAFTPPPVYTRWWAMVEGCSGRRRDFGSVRWLVVPAVDSFVVGGQAAAGYFARTSDDIVVAESRQYDGGVIRHEMLHALLRASGHPRAAFLGACEGTVICVGSCVSDAGPPPPTDPRATRVSPRALVLAVDVDPSRPSIAADGGYFSVTVSARNPAPTPVVVALPPSGDAGPPAAFGFALEGSHVSVFYNERIKDAGLAQFGPGEVKRWVFDFRGGDRPGDGALPPDTYRVRGRFSTEEVAGATPFELLP